MVERKGTHGTILPRIADGQDLPATLPDHLVGPSIISDPDIRNEAETASALVVEQLGTLPARTNIAAIMGLIMGTLQQLYEPLAVTALKRAVFDCLVKHGHIRRTHSSHKSVVYDIRQPVTAKGEEQPTTTKDEALRMLIRRVEGLIKVNEDLKAELAEAKHDAPAINPDIIEQLASKLEATNQRVELLKRELADMHKAREQGTRQHQKELHSLRTELTVANATITRLEGEIETGQHKNSTLDPGIAERLKALEIEF